MPSFTTTLSVLVRMVNLGCSSGVVGGLPLPLMMMMEGEVWGEEGE